MKNWIIKNRYKIAMLITLYIAATVGYRIIPSARSYEEGLGLFIITTIIVCVAIYLQAKDKQ